MIPNILMHYVIKVYSPEPHNTHPTSKFICICVVNDGLQLCLASTLTNVANVAVSKWVSEADEILSYKTESVIFDVRYTNFIL